MRWFGREQPRELWEEAIEWPIGDIEASERIRNICRSAAGSADVVGGARADEATRGAQGRREQESARYQSAAKAAMEIAMKVSDELMRDAAVKEIVVLCVKANDIKTARILFRAMRAPSIRGDLLREYPDLQQ